MKKAAIFGMCMMIWIMLLTSTAYAFDPFRAAGNEPLNKAGELALGSTALAILDHSYINSTLTITNITYWSTGNGASPQVTEFRCMYEAPAGTWNVRAIANKNVTVQNDGTKQEFAVNLSGCQIGDSLGYYAHSGDAHIEQDADAGCETIWIINYCNPSCNGFTTGNNRNVSLEAVVQDYSTEYPNPPLIIMTNPSNASGTGFSNVSLNANVTINHSLSILKNISLWLNSTGVWKMNQTNTSEVVNSTITEFNVTLEDGDYLWTIIACDTYDNCSTYWNFDENRTLYVDTSYPSCTNLIDHNVTFSQLYNFSSTCTDENFFSLSVNCTGSDYFNHSQYYIDEDTYYFFNETNISEATSCVYEYCDGHTFNDLTKDPIYISYNDSDSIKVFDDTVIIEIVAPTMDDFKSYMEEKKDKYIFDVKSLIDIDKINFTITSDDEIFIMTNGDYPAWIVTSKYWIDFDDKDLSWWKVSHVPDTDNKKVLVELKFSKSKKNFKFNSIGKINCVSGSFDLTEASTPAGGNFTLKRFECDNTATPSVMMLIGFTFIVTIIWMFSLWSKIPILNILVGFVIVYFAWYIAQCFFLANVLFIIMGIVSMIMGILQSFTSKNAIGGYIK